jgi:hypothetical protein
MVNQPGFWPGFVVGFVLAGFLGVLSQRLRLALKDFKGGYSPQMALVPTKRSPSDAMRASVVGLLRIVWWLLLGVLGLVVAYFVMTS